VTITTNIDGYILLQPVDRCTQYKSCDWSSLSV